NIHLRDQLLLQLNGKKYWIFHGDVFDLMLQYSPILTRIGGKGYDYLLYLNRAYNKLRQRFGRRSKSLAQSLKKQVKGAVRFVDRFENLAAKFAADKGCDYVVCGHIHKPNMRLIEHEQGNVTYLNSGDWVENLTALEYNWGIWTIFTYYEVDFEYLSPRLQVRDAEHDEDDQEFPMGEQFVEQILQKGTPGSV
ncbi:MAG: UDP-2,3-diacylglucosamine diphosphatase, partial [Bacteroidota bacterium]